jgi:hypothetical protein
MKKTKKKKAALLLQSGNSGAANQSRTDDLILTKDVLYQLSHSSVQRTMLLYQVRCDLSIAILKVFNLLL